jgi:putative tryptophan/tyrosine transport system substrate-binding protein
MSCIEPPGTGMRRREFITLVGGAAATWPLAARAQQPERIRRVGVLVPYIKQDLVDRDDVATFTQEFRRLGWEEGRNFHLEYRGEAPNVSQLRSAAADLVSLKPEVILVQGAEALRATQLNTNTIPIVFAGLIDPVQRGFVESLAHPGGNVTGLSAIGSSICSQWLKLLKEISPNLRHFAVIYNPETTTGNWVPLVKSVAPVFGLEVNEAAVNDDDDIDGVLGALKTHSDAGVVVLPGFFTMVHRQRIIDFARRWNLPAVYWDRRFVNDGGLMSYAFSVDPLERQAVAYVDRILKGEKAGEIPVQEATRFELVINLKTAKTLGLTVPPSLLARADEVIE